jgi:hypothetical protein
MDPGVLAMAFAILTTKLGTSKNAARNRLAEQHGVSVGAIKKALTAYEDEAIRIVHGVATKS